MEAFFTLARTPSDKKTFAHSLARIILIYLSMFSLLAPQTVAKAAVPQKVTIAFAAISPLMAGVWMAKEIGAYEKYGLQANLVFIASGGIAVASQISGDLDMAVAASNAVVAAVHQGARIIAVGSVTNRPGAALWVQPQISTPAELEGKSLGISRMGSMSHFLTLLTLQKFGLQSKVNIQQHGDGPSLDLAFRAGLIAGRVAPLAPAPGARSLADLAELGIPYSMDYITVSQDYLKKNRPTVEALLKAYIEGVAALHKRKQKAMQMLSKYSRGPSGDQEESYKYAIKYLERYPRVNPDTVQTVLDWMKVSDVSLNRFFDNSVIETINRQGLIDELYR